MHLSNYPVHLLKNTHITVPVFLIDDQAGFYRGTRFDWAGMIGMVEYGGQKIFTPWQDPHDPANARHGIGPATEFGTIAFNETEPGFSFLKIGVGALTKPDDNKRYLFGRRYDFIFANKPWRVEPQADHVHFQHEAQSALGHAYCYDKIVRLADHGFDLIHHLANTGSQALNTNCYQHNFIIINGQPVAAGHRLSVPFALDLDEKASTTSQDKLSVGTHDLIVLNDIGDHAVAGHLVRHPVPYSWTYHTDQLSITATSDAPCSRFFIWGTQQTFCPEPFININLQPGECMDWTIRYRFAMN